MSAGRSNFQVFEAEGNARALIREFEVPAEDVFEECKTAWPRSGTDSPCAAFGTPQQFAAIHPDRGGDNARLAELNAARDTLLAAHPDRESDPR